MRRLGREDRLEEVGGARKLAPREGRSDDRRHDGQGLVEGLLLQAQPAQKQPRRLGIGIQGERLLGRAHGLGPLAHLQLRLGEESEALGRSRRRLEHGHGGIGVLLGKQRTDEVLLGVDVVGRELERLLEDLRGLVVGAALQEHVADEAVLHDGLLLLVGGTEKVRQPHLDAQVGGVDRRHLLVDRDRVLEAVVLLVVVGEDLVLAASVLGEPLLVVQLGELVVDLELGRIDLVDLLVDRDRLQEEAVLPVEVGDPREVGDRLPGPVHPDIQVPDLIQGRDVFGVLLEDAQVLFQRLIDLASGQELLGGLEDLFAVDRHLV